MKLTTFTDYSLRVLMYVAARQGERATIAEIAAAFGISRNHLMKVVNALSRNGWLANVRGRGGGLQLAIPPEAIVIGAVVRQTEGVALMAECFDPAHCGCALAPVCALRDVMSAAVRSFYATLDRYTLADVTRNRAELARVLFHLRAPAARPAASSAFSDGKVHGRPR